MVHVNGIQGTKLEARYIEAGGRGQRRYWACEMKNSIEYMNEANRRRPERGLL